MEVSVHASCPTLVPHLHTFRSLSDAEYLEYLREDEAGGGKGAAAVAPPKTASTAVASAHASHTSGGGGGVDLGVDAPLAASLEVVSSALAALSLMVPSLPSSRAASGSSGGARVSSGGAAAGGGGGTVGGGGGGGGGRRDRLRSRLGLLLAREHFAAGNLSAARGLLLQACNVYRR